MNDQQKGEQQTDEQRDDTGSGISSSSRQHSGNSDEHSSNSNLRFRRPTNVKEFASQASAVATMILNDEISVEKGQSYASLARVVAQTVSSEVTRSRFLKEEPDLGLDDEIMEGDDDTRN